MTTKQILIVDDDRETCRLIAELVGSPDRSIAEAVSARQALDQIRATPFDLVISDINLNAAQGVVERNPDTLQGIFEREAGRPAMADYFHSYSLIVYNKTEEKQE